MGGFAPHLRCGEVNSKSVMRSEWRWQRLGQQLAGAGAGGAVPRAALSRVGRQVLASRPQRGPDPWGHLSLSQHALQFLS